MPLSLDSQTSKSAKKMGRNAIGLLRKVETLTQKSGSLKGAGKSESNMEVNKRLIKYVF